ncbi:MAG: dihydroorotate dehydrogenase electron transfer subunit [Bacteroidota bacterium]
MVITNAVVSQSYALENSVIMMKLHAPEIARSARPGQFCNIRISSSSSPLLRRPFSICEAEGEYISFLFNIFGEGTKLLSAKKPGETVDILGPLGNGFDLEGDFETAVIVAGGIGAAPFPFLLSKLDPEKMVYTFLGARSSRYIIKYGLKNELIATDDGTVGFKGNVIELLNANMQILSSSRIKIFGCGPTPMLRALQDFSLKNNFHCELSTETAMACGFGICQGCPIEAADKDGYYLVCKDGPVFDARRVKI